MFGGPTMVDGVVVPEPMRDVVLLMTVSGASSFGGHVQALREAWGMASVVGVVERAVSGCARWVAS